MKRFEKFLRLPEHQPIEAESKDHEDDVYQNHAMNGNTNGSTRYTDKDSTDAETVPQLDHRLFTPDSSQSSKDGTPNDIPPPSRALYKPGVIFHNVSARSVPPTLRTQRQPHSLLSLTPNLFHVQLDKG